MNYEKALKLACKEITENLTEFCPLYCSNTSSVFNNTCSEEEATNCWQKNLSEKAANCWQKYFLEKAESGADNG